MKNSVKWGTLVGASAVVALMGLAGCGGGGGETAAGDNAVPDAIKSPVMTKEDDQATAGTDTGNATSNAAGSTP